MKTVLLLINCLAISSFVKAQTNVYHSFPDSNVVWNYNLQHYCFSIGTMANENYSITIPLLFQLTLSLTTRLITSWKRLMYSQMLMQAVTYIQVVTKGLFEKILWQKKYTLWLPIKM